MVTRNHFRDCVNYVYGCSDMTECVPTFDFAPQKTFTIGMAARAANKNYKSAFFGKWCAPPTNLIMQAVPVQQTPSRS